MEQLAAARRERWHQNGEPLLTLEAAREWVNELGIVLFAPRAHQLPTPAPSLVEATLGSAVSAPTALESEAARELVARMVAEGSALPLNLLGGPGDVPDFVVSAQAFSYLFTLRGDKNWKQPPSTSGPVKVSPLALKVYEALAAGNALTASELVAELGREVTENAIARALGELWMQLRVIPLLQDGAAATMWELTSRRFTKQIKAGANAGQPTALSAAISFYLAQALAATDEEVETFLSPLTARSKVRDVMHGLTAARQLENAVLEGKTLVYIPGALPEFPEVAAADPAVNVADIAAAAVLGAVVNERIKKFDRPRASRPPREDRGERPSRKPGGARGGARKPFGEKRYERPAGKAGGKSFAERERRPLQRDRAAGERSGFTRPWDEERASRPRREEGERPAAKKPFRRDEEGRGGEKREFRGGPRGAARGKSGPREERPFRPRREGEREGFASRPKKTFSRAARAIAKDLRRVRRRHFVRVVKASGKGLHRVRRRHFSRAARAIAKDLHRVRRRHFVRVVKVSGKGLHHGHRNRIVLAVRVNVKGLRRARRSRFEDARRVVERVARSGRSVERERIRPEGVVREGRARSGVESRDLQGRNLAARRSLVSGSSAVSGRPVERLRLQASRSRDRERGM